MEDHDSLAEKTLENINVCIINKTQPMFQPNVYLCDVPKVCCTSRGQPACCSADVDFPNIFSQALPIFIVFALFIVIAMLVRWYFHDEDPNKPKELSNSKNKRTIQRFMFPTDSDVVEDPIFGTIYEEKAPVFAYVENREEKEVRYRHQSTKPVKEIAHPDLLLKGQSPTTRSSDNA